MKTLKHILFTIAVLFCFSIVASAQKQDKKPPKDPPVVVVKDRKDKDKPKEDKDKKDNVKKPPMEYYLSENQIETNLI